MQSDINPAVLFTGLMWCVAIGESATIHAAPPIAIEVKEPVGIRRFQYPVSVPLHLPKAVARETPLRLLREGKPVLAQVCPTEAGATVARWRLDFPVDLLPFQSAVYELQYGPGVVPGPAPQQGHKLTSLANEFRIANDLHIEWTVPLDLGGILSSVRAGHLEYLRGGAAGLHLRDRNGKLHAVGGSGARPTASVIRGGPLAVGLKFDFQGTSPPARSTVELTFPATKTWVEVDWRIDDPAGWVAGAEAGLNVNLDPPTRQAATLVDFGATGLVYLSLGPGQQSRLLGGADPWQVLRGQPDRLEPFVAESKQPVPHARPEGWAHVMDRRRCLAVAFHQFAAGTDDRLDVTAGGQVELRRSFPAARAATPKQLRFWLHFIPFPPQETAATSPQAMQNPVVTRVRVAEESPP